MTSRWQSQIWKGLSFNHFFMKSGSENVLHTFPQLSILHWSGFWMGSVLSGLLQITHGLSVTRERFLVLNSILWILMCANNKNFLPECICSINIITLACFVLENQWRPVVSFHLNCLQWNCTERRKAFGSNELQGVFQASRNITALVKCSHCLCDVWAPNSWPPSWGSLPLLQQNWAPLWDHFLDCLSPTSAPLVALKPSFRSRKKPTVPSWGAEDPLLCHPLCYPLLDHTESNFRNIC